MKRIVIFCALCALFGCRQANVPQTDPIALYYSTVEQSKTDLLIQGDQIGVFAAVEGTEHYFLDNVKYIVGADGRSLSTSPAVYYPESKQAVAFMAYLPFGGTWDGGVGTFSVPSDQTTAAALKQADLCWATASSTPVATPVALEFTHKMARLLITTNTPTEKIAIPNAFSGGILDIKTGAFTNTLRSEVFTTGTELILPAQSVARLVLTVAGVDYTFEGAIALETAKTTSISLTLNPTTHTATLSGSSTTDWTGSATTGNPTQAVSNVLTMHWPNYLPQGATPDKVVLTINNTDYTVSSGITYADQTFTVPFASSVLRYPYTITKIAFNNIPLACTQLLGATIYKSAAQTLGIKDPTGVLINKVLWATGNLVASNAAAGAAGVGGCKIGAPGDGGLYFQFGSLIGYKGGSTGTGTGMPSKANGTYWNGGSWGSFAADAQVWPTNLSGTPSSWPQGATTNQWYFGLQSGWSTGGQNIRDYPGFSAGDLADKGVGDPCTYYLGGTWRLPTTAEIVALCNNQGGGGWVPWATAGGSWTTSPTFGGNFQGTKLFFPASGHRNYSAGSFHNVTTRGYCWSSSVNGATGGDGLLFEQPSGVIPQNINSRSYGFPVRCVSSVP